MDIIMEDRSTVLLCDMYWPQWQGNASLVYMTDNLDDIMAAYNCQNAIIVGDLNQYLVIGDFTELTVVQGMFNH